MTAHTAGTVGKTYVIGTNIAFRFTFEKGKQKKPKYDISRVHTPTRAHLIWTHCSWVWLWWFWEVTERFRCPFVAPITHQESLLHLNWQLIKTKFSLPSRQIVKRSGSFDTDSNIFPTVSLKTLGKKMPTRHFTVIVVTFGEYWLDLLKKWCTSPMRPFLFD